MQTDARRYERLVDHELSSTQQRSIDWVPQGSRVLELGCATGFIGTLLVRDKGCQVVGAEIDPAAAAEAQARGLEVHVGTLEDAAFRRSIEGPFDVVMATDVLEHLSDPAAVFDDLRRWLKPDGLAIVAVPNVAVWSMRLALLRGHFDYAESGLLDRTHLHFFTRETLRELVRKQGWQIEDEWVDRWEVPGLEQLMWHLPLRLRARLGNEPSAGWRRHVFAKLGRVTAWHQSIGLALGRSWPNLCGDHFALLLRPPPR